MELENVSCPLYLRKDSRDWLKNILERRKSDSKGGEKQVFSSDSEGDY